MDVRRGGQVRMRSMGWDTCLDSPGRNGVFGLAVSPPFHAARTHWRTSMQLGVGIHVHIDVHGVRHGAEGRCRATAGSNASLWQVSLEAVRGLDGCSHDNGD